MMFMPSFVEVLLLLFAPVLNGGQRLDLLSMVEPQAALEVLGEKTDDDSVLKLLAGEDTAAAGGDYDKKEAEKAIQNLASSTESIRDGARDKLAGLGAALRPRLEEVVAKDPRRAEEAKKVLAVLDSARAGATRKQTVAKLLAARVAGERKLEKAVPALTAAASSGDRFLAAAAERSLVALGRAPASAAPGSAPATVAVNALPRGTRVLVAARTKPASASAEALGLAKLIQDFAGKMGVPKEQIDSQIAELTGKVVQFVVEYGNVSLDGVYVANVGSVGPMGAGVGVVVIGDYERPLLEAALEKSSSFWTVSETAGKKVFTSMAARLIPLDDRSLLVLPQQASKHFPLAAYLADFAARKSVLAADARWAKFVETLAGPATIRALALTDASLMEEIYKELETEPEAAPIVDSVKAMRELELDIAPLEGTKQRIRLEGTFADDDKARALVDFLRGQIQNGVSEMEAQLAQFDVPPLRMAIEVMKSIRVSAEGKKGILRLELDPTVLLSTFSVGAAEAVVPAADE